MKIYIKKRIGKKWRIVLAEGFVKEYDPMFLRIGDSLRKIQQEKLKTNHQKVR